MYFYNKHHSIIPGGGGRDPPLHGLKKTNLYKIRKRTWANQSHYIITGTGAIGSH